MTRWVARCAFFLSGVAGLTFEIVWTRHLGLAMGATTLAVATTTAAYMGGLALGSHIGGRFVDPLADRSSWQRSAPVRSSVRCQDPYLVGSGRCMPGWVWRSP